MRAHFPELIMVIAFEFWFLLESPPSPLLSVGAAVAVAGVVFGAAIIRNDSSANTILGSHSQPGKEALVAGIQAVPAGQQPPSGALFPQ